jgi:hypothetical protein
MAIIPINCGCEDAPCCGCSEVAYTGEDAIDMAREHEDAQGILDDDEDDGHDCEPDDSMDGDFDSAMASAGFGTDEDYGDYGCCDIDAYF